MTAPLRTARTRGAFTLLELMVAIIILAILAALAVPTFSKVIEKTYDHTAAQSLMAAGRNSAAQARIDGADRFTQASVEGSIGEMYGAAGAGTSVAGTYAAGNSWKLNGTATDWSAVLAGGGLGLPAGGSEQYGTVGFAYGTNYQSLGYVTRSKSGRCVYTLTQMTGRSIWWTGTTKWAICPGGAALLPPVDDPGGQVTESGPVVAVPVGPGPGGGPTAPVTTLAQPQGVNVHPVGENPVVAWQPVPNAERYTIRVTVDLVTTTINDVTTPQGFVVPAPLLVPEKVYTFDVTAHRGTISSIPSAPVQLNVALQAPVLTTAWFNIAGSYQETVAQRPLGLNITWNWTSVLGAQGYKMQGLSSTGTWVDLLAMSFPATQTSYLDDSPTNDVFTRRIVPKFNGVFRTDLASNTTVTNGTPLSPNRNETKAANQPDGRSVQVTHATVATADSYVLWYSGDSGVTWKHTAPHTGTTASFPTEPDRDYKASVGAVRNGVIGEMNVPFSIYTIPAPIIVVPAGNTAAWAVKNYTTDTALATVDLTWVTQPAAEGTLVYCSSSEVLDGDTCGTGSYGKTDTTTTSQGRLAKTATRSEFTNRYVYLRSFKGGSLSAPSRVIYTTF